MRSRLLAARARRQKHQHRLLLSAAPNPAVAPAGKPVVETRVVEMAGGTAVSPATAVVTAVAEMEMETETGAETGTETETGRVAAVAASRQDPATATAMAAAIPTATSMRKVN